MDFEELDRQATPIGEISVRRRFDLVLEAEVYEVKLGDEFLMSSAFHESEVELAKLALAAVDGDGLDVVVGGLGLGYTARAVLEDERVASLRVVEALDAVVGWHAAGLLPLSAALTADERCTFVGGDFFAIVRDEAPFGPDGPQQVDALIVDIDHSPSNTLDPGHDGFYTLAGQRQVATRLNPKGAFALWSDDPPDDGYVATATGAFGRCDAHVVSFPNPYTRERSACTVYVAHAE